MNKSICTQGIIDDKIYNSMHRKVVEILRDDSNFTMDTLKNEEVDIYGAMAFLVSKCGTQKTGSILSKIANVNTAESIYREKIQLKPAPYLSQDESEKMLVQCSFGTNASFRGIGDLLLDCTKDIEVVASVIVDACIISANGYSEKGNMLQSPFSAVVIVISHWMKKRFRWIIGRIRTIKYGKFEFISDEKMADDIADTMKNIYTERHAHNVCIEYMHRALRDKSDPEREIYYDLMDEFMTSLAKTSKHSEYAKKLINDAERFILDGKHFNEHIIETLNKRFIKRLALLLASSYMCCTSRDARFTFDVIHLYTYKRLNEDKRNITTISDDALRLRIIGEATYISNIESTHRYRFLQEYFGVLASKIKESTKATEAAEAKANRLEEKAVVLKQEIKSIKKDNNRLKETLKAAELDREKLERLTAIGASNREIDRLNAKINRNRIEIDKLKDDNNEAIRIISKRDREIEIMNKRVAKVESERDELSEKYERQLKISQEMATHRAFNDISIQCFINAIKNYKIALIGGDMMFAKLAEYGLDNIRTYKAGCRNIEYEDISDMDLVVAATAFVDHSTMEKVVAAKRSHNINLMMFNNKNADMLIFAIFNELYK